MPLRVRLPRGFTLIELLVVISIIALLISILLPALRQARDSARAIQCGSSIRQVGINMAIYHLEWKDRSMVSKDDWTKLVPGTEIKDQPQWWQQLMYLNGGPDRDFFGGRPWEVYFKHYDQSVDAMRSGLASHGCASYEDEWIRQSAGGGSTYQMNIRMRPGNYAKHSTWLAPWTNGGGGGKAPNWPLAQDWHQGMAILTDGTAWFNEGVRWFEPNTNPEDKHPFAGDSTQGGPDARRFAAGGSGGDPQRHVGTANYLFIDGHVERLSPEDGWYAAMNPDRATDLE